MEETIFEIDRFLWIAGDPGAETVRIDVRSVDGNTGSICLNAQDARTMRDGLDTFLAGHSVAEAKAELMRATGRYVELSNALVERMAENIRDDGEGNPVLMLEDVDSTLKAAREIVMKASAPVSSQRDMAALAYAVSRVRRMGNMLLEQSPEWEEFDPLLQQGTLVEIETGTEYAKILVDNSDYGAWTFEVKFMAVVDSQDNGTTSRYAIPGSIHLQCAPSVDRCLVEYVSIGMPRMRAAA